MSSDKQVGTIDALSLQLNLFVTFEEIESQRLAELKTVFRVFGVFMSAL